MTRSMQEIDAAPAPQPTEIRLSQDKRTLTVAFDDGPKYVLAAEILRVESPSAEVMGHGPGQKQIVPGKRDVKILMIAPNGNYAIRLGFDDGHGTGIFSWRYLRFVGENQEGLMADYLDALDEQGLSRDT